jgi:hypothetical protein
MSETDMKKGQFGRIALVIVVLAIGVAAIAPRFMRGAVHEAKGTITYIDPAERTISVEVIDPANGSTREFSGIVSTDCAITINGAPAAFADLRVDDTIQARARIEHGDGGPDGTQKKRLTAERIEVTRPENETS